MAIIPKVSVLKIVKIIGDDKKTRPYFYILILIQREKTPTELAGKNNWKGFNSPKYSLIQKWF